MVRYILNLIENTHQERFRHTKDGLQERVKTQSRKQTLNSGYNEYKI